MAFNIKMSLGRDHATGAMVHTVVVTIDNHETVLSFETKEQAEAFAQVERARLSETKSPRGNKRPVEKAAQAERRSVESQQPQIQPIP